MQCVYCDQTQNLNTSLTITLADGSKTTVSICDTHAEEATIKSAREAYEKKQEKIDEVIQMAKSLGLSISQSAGGVVIAQNNQPQQPKQLPQPVTELDPTDPDVISTARVDRQRGVSSVGGSTEFGAVESYHSISPSSLEDQLPDAARQGVVKMTVVEGRDGQPLAVQQKRVDGTGTTVYNIVKAEDDNKLQSRFKKMAQESMSGKVPNFARQGYSNTTANCPMCRGNCTIKSKSGVTTCPKCKGAGVISVY